MSTDSDVKVERAGLESHRSRYIETSPASSAKHPVIYSSTPNGFITALESIIIITAINSKVISFPRIAAALVEEPLATVLASPADAAARSALQHES